MNYENPEPESPWQRRPPRDGEGRPRAVIDLLTVEKAASIGCTLEDIAVITGVGRSTFFRHRDEDPALNEAIEKGQATGRTALRRLQFQRAEAGSDSMLIWLGKQLLGQKDNAVVAHTGPSGGPVQSVTVFTNDPVEAAKIYQKMMTED